MCNLLVDLKYFSFTHVLTILAYKPIVELSGFICVDTPLTNYSFGRWCPIFIARRYT